MRYIITSMPSKHLSESSHHDHSACMQQAMREAEALCDARGARLTPVRRRVLGLVWSSHKAVKAYDLLEQIEHEDGAQAPPTVYRALDFLMEHGLVHKVESINAFVGCAHPAETHGCQFFVCRGCGNITECCEESIRHAVERNARAIGFTPARHVLEVHGQCAECGKESG